MAELLLSRRASPFQSDGSGRTCMDEAVLEGAGNLLRRFEQLCIWKGTVAVKVSDPLSPHSAPLQRCHTHVLRC